MKELSFADVFDIDLPLEKKPESKSDKKKVADKENKSKTTGKKKKDKVKYVLPATVNTEVGQIVIDGIGEITKDELEKKMPVPMNVIQKDDILIGIYETSEFKENDDVEMRKVFVPHPNDNTAYELLNDENVRIEDTRKPFALGKYKTYRYPENMASNWNLKIPSTSKIGFIGSQQRITMETDGGDVNIKQLVNEWLKQNDWVKLVDFIYVFDKETDGCYVTIQLVNKKIEENDKTVRVKLPVKMSFLHDPGPLEMLTPDMFNGKEYVTEQDIFNIVDKYFPNIYVCDNVDISYIDTVNTVSFMKLGRKKGAGAKGFSLRTSVADFNIKDGVLSYRHNISCIPYKLMLEIYDYFVSKLPNEALARIMYSKKEHAYYVKYMELADTTLTGVAWRDDVCDEGEYVVMEVHSHNSMPAFFSEIDDQDEVLPMLYGVMGCLDTEYPDFKIRAGYGGIFCEMAYWDVFMTPRIVNDNLIVLSMVGANALLLNIKTNNLVVAHGIHMAPNGAMSWGYGSYYGTDFLKVNFDDVKQELQKN